MNRRTMLQRMLATALVLLSGCEEYHETATPVFQKPKHDYLLAFVLDTSGSFMPKMFSGRADAYQFFCSAAEQFFRDRVGSDDKIVIAQLSAEKRTLLWEGDPLSLKRRFRSASELQKFLAENSNPNGSRVYAAIADTLDYIMDMPGVVEGETRVIVVVLSDMDENTSDAQESRARFVSPLRRFSRQKGGIGFYCVDPQHLSECRQCVRDAGIQDGIVESLLNDKPQLPRCE